MPSTMARALTVTIPLLLMVYGAGRYIDGRDGAHGPGPAWDIGHAAFLVAFIGFGALTLHFWRTSSQPAGGAILLYVSTLIGVSLFLWVIITDLAPALDERASLPDAVVAVGPPLFVIGFVGSLALHTRSATMRWWAAPPLLALVALVLASADLDLLPITAVLLGLALVPVGRHQTRAR